MSIVSIVGKKRSGKDTTADILVKEFGAVKYALATPIKLALHHAYNETRAYHKCGVHLSFHDIDGSTEYDRESQLILSNSDVIDLMTKALEFLKIGFNLKSTNINDWTESGVLYDRKIISENSEPWSVRRLMQLLGTDIVCNFIDTQFWNRCMVQRYISEFDKNPNVIFIITDVRQQHELDFIRELGAKMIFIERPSINNCTKDTHITEAGLLRKSIDPLIINDGSIDDLKEQILNLFRGN